MKEEKDSSRFFVVDSSFVLAWLLPDKQENEVDELFSRQMRGEVVFVSHSLLDYEVMNVLKSVCIQGRLEEALVVRLWNNFKNLGFSYEDVDLFVSFEFAMKNSLSVYDASYGVLARELGVPLLTLDERLEKAVG